MDNRQNNSLTETDTESEKRRRLRELFFRIHSGLPREGPGSRDATVSAFRLLELPRTPLILDVGSGPGRQTTDLADVSPGTFVAMDTHREYLDALQARSAQQGVSARIHPIQASMLAIPFADGVFDAIWAEGAIYIIGFEKGLREWRRLLREDGYIAASHLSWLSMNVPNEARMFWEKHYPAIATIETNVAIAVAAGFDVVDCWTLPESAWWDDYYRPLERRLAELRAEHQGDDAALSVIHGARQQIDLYRRYSGAYGYVFYVLRKTNDRLLNSRSAARSDR
jgi:SAM-dependent methyltransferase